MNLAKLKQLIAIPSPDWKDISPLELDHISFCKVDECDKMSHCITVSADCSWNVCVYGHKIQPQNCTLLNSIPSRIDHRSVSHLMSVIDSSSICKGNEDEKFLDMIARRKEKNIVSADGSTVAYLDTTKVRLAAVFFSVIMTIGIISHLGISYSQNQYV